MGFAAWEAKVYAKAHSKLVMPDGATGYTCLVPQE